MIGEIENAIIERIKDIHNSGVLGYGLESIKSYAGDAGDKPKRATRDYPAVWTIYLNSSKNKDHPSFINYTAHFYVVCAAQSLRNEKDSRYGGNGKVGAAQIAEDCISMLHGFTPDIGNVKKINCGDIDPLSVDKDDKSLASIYALKIDVPYTFTPDKFNIDDGVPLEKIHTNWDLPPNGEVGETLPDDENADATSHITGD